MKRFKFRLETLVNLRKSAEEKALQEYVESIDKRKNQEKICDELKENLILLTERVKISRDQTDFSEFKMSYQANFLDYIGTQKEILSSANKILQFLLREEDKFRLNFIEKKKQVDILEKLREKQKIVFDKESSSAEEKSIEDLVMSQYNCEKF